MPTSQLNKQKVIKKFVLTYKDELVERVGWLIMVRWLAGLGVSTTVIVSSILFDLLFDRNLLLLVSSSIFICNIIYLIYYRRLRAIYEQPSCHRRVDIFANVQISVDLIILITLIYFSGGAENPFFFYFIFHMIIASILLSTTASYLQATLAVLLFNLMLLFEWLGLIPHHRLFPFFEKAVYDNPIFLLGLSAVFTSTIYLSVYMATSIVSKLRTREGELLELKDSLEQTNLEMHKIYEYRSRFILKVEHELKAPLAAIQSLLTVILTSFPDSLTPKITELLVRAEKRTHNLLVLIRRLLSLSRMQIADYHFQMQPVDLKSIITKQMEMMRSQAEDKAITLETKFSEDLPMVLGDQEALEQMIMNLLSNAVKYTEKGAVKVEAAANGEFIELSVTDTGIGMSEEEQEMIFEEFYRGAQAKDKYEGTGLGLSIVWEIVDGHGGMIEVESTPGKGSRFTVTLPKLKDQA
ncbi:MAG TPA: HAMP domain-containing sensor histidine kinase [archaeon]|nr:HAMP domain-containing sensor histidine kinase [archaeon]